MRKHKLKNLNQLVLITQLRYDHDHKTEGLELGLYIPDYALHKELSNKQQTEYS